MKIFRHRNLMGCIYALLMAIPFVAIAVKSAYVVVNKNAYQSYSGLTTSVEIVENNKYETNVVNAQNDLIIGNIYEFDLNNWNELPENNGSSFTISYLGC